MAESDDENFVTFGNALEPLDEECLPRKKPVTVEDQYALDAQGRRRFHGAFTGGFSAGYFNSVGTRDGWRPQQFKSSRSNKAGGVAQRPEDFMDEEDTGQFGIAPTGIRANSDFVDHGRRGTKRERRKNNEDGPIPGVPVLQELLKPTKDTVGVTLLKRMGWRPGQGIGPRITKREKNRTRRRNDEAKIYGCSLPDRTDNPADTDSEASEDNGEDVLFAPDDYEPFVCNPKDNCFGIGYAGLDRRPVLSGHVNLFEAPTSFKLREKNRKLSIRGQAFGVGAFEADDEDIYERDDMSRYDFALGPEKRIEKSRWSGKKGEAETSRANHPEGFAPAVKRLERKKIFEPPELPRDFEPYHVVRKSRFYPPIEPSPSSLDGASRKGSYRATLSAVDRARILGDTNEIDSQGQRVHGLALHGIVDSGAVNAAGNIIARSLNLHGRERTEERRRLESRNDSAAVAWMSKLSSKSFVSGGVEGNDPAASGSLKNLRDFKVDASVDRTAGPFLVDPDKQTRFEKYVELARRGDRDRLESVQPLSMTEWERQREKEEFEQASRIFGESERVSDTTESSTGVSVDASLGGKFVDCGSSRETFSQTESLDERMRNAARMKLFGKLTRTREVWQPASIVCKRFNIPEPQGGCCVKREKPFKSERRSIFDSLEFGPVTERFEGASGQACDETAHSAADEETRRSEVSSRLAESSESKSTIKMRSFEASYEKVFGSVLPPISETADEIDDEASIVAEQREDSLIVKVEASAEGAAATSDKPVDKKDLFKAIFLSSSEDSDSDKGEDEDDSEAVKSLLIGETPSRLNVRRNDSPPRGIFAKLDLDSLAGIGARLAATSADASTTIVNENRTDEMPDGRTGSSDRAAVGKDECEATSEREVESLPPDVYGPALPVRIAKNDDSCATGGSSSNATEFAKPIFRSVVVARRDNDDGGPKGEWVERGRAKKSKKEKREHRRKEKKRSRHKRKSKKDKR